jgi:hypothetical protein
VHQHQIKLKPAGKWHRKQGHGDVPEKTACGETIGPLYFSREWVLDENLCPVCFTNHERDTGEMQKLEREAVELREQTERIREKFEEFADEITDEVDPPPHPPPDDTTKKPPT